MAEPVTTRDTSIELSSVSRDMEDDENKKACCFSWWKRLRRLCRRNRRRNTAKHREIKGEDPEEAQAETEYAKEMKEIEVKEKSAQEHQEVELRVTQEEGEMDEGAEKEPETGEVEERCEEKVEEVIHLEKENEEVVKEEMGKKKVEVIIHLEKDDRKEVAKEQGLVAAEESLAQGVAPAADEEGWTVVRHKKRRPRRKEAPSAVAEAKASSGEAPRRQAKEAARKARWETQQAVSSVRASWQEKVTEAVVPVAPHMRRHIVGPRGAILRELLREFDRVKVAVPPPRDTATRTITVRGPPRQVNGAVARVQALLQNAEVVEVQVEVAPEQRRHVVGPGGATVRKLKQQFPDMLVGIPAAGNKTAHVVRLKGPRLQVTGAQAFLQACLEAVHAAHHSARPHSRSATRPTARRPTRP